MAVKTANSKAEYVVSSQYVINRGTKGHRTLHIYNNPSCYYSRGVFFVYEEFDSLEEAMQSDPIPQKCKICFPNQHIN